MQLYIGPSSVTRHVYVIIAAHRSLVKDIAVWRPWGATHFLLDTSVAQTHTHNEQGGVGGEWNWVKPGAAILRYNALVL